MPDGKGLTLFLIASLALLMTPGPTVTYIVTTSLSQGRKAGLVSALGMGVGGLLHVTAAALGLLAAVASSRHVLVALRFGGAAFLIGLGLQRAFGRDRAEANTTVPREGPGRVFWQGMVVNALNPNRVLFFLAVIPRFVSPRGAMLPQVLFLGLTFVTMAIVTDSLWALAASTTAALIGSRVGLGRSGRYLAAAIYVTLGLAVALSGPGHD